MSESERSAAETTARNTTLLVRWFIWVPLAAVGFGLVFGIVAAVTTSVRHSTEAHKLAEVRSTYQTAGFGNTDDATILGQARGVCANFQTGGEAFAISEFATGWGVTPAQAYPLVESIHRNMC